MKTSEAWVAIVTGVGDAFCTGADLKTYIPQVTEMAAADGENRTDVIDGYRLDDGIKAVLRGVKIYKPIIAAVNGVCVAGGMEMLGGCDIRVAVPGATFAVMEPKRGLVRRRRHDRAPATPDPVPPGDGVPALRGPDPGGPGLRDGPSQRGRPDRGAARRRDAVTRYRITANGPFAVRKTKESVLRGLATDMKEAYKIESAISAEVFSSEDAKEGPAAFAEKRPPRWTGR